MKLSSDPTFLLLPVVALVVIVVLVVRRWIGKQQLSPVERVVKSFMAMTIAFGMIMMGLYFLMPMTPTLSTFARPVEINSLNEVLKYLQDYNDALVRTIQVVQLFFGLFMLWLMASLAEFSQMV